MKAKYVIILTLLVGGIVYALLDPALYTLMPKCPFRLLTGLSCPGCGIQRAAHALLHGHLWEAVQYNFFMVFSIPYAASLVAAHWLVGSRWREKMLPVLESRVMMILYIVLFLVWWVVRNLLGI